MTDAKAKPEPRPADPEATLAWEAAHRRQGAFSAWAAGALTIIGALITQIGLSGRPNFDSRAVTIPDAMRDLAAGQPIPPGQYALTVQWLGDKAPVLIASTVVAALGAFLFFFPLAFLARAIRGRRPGFSQIYLIAGAIGAVLFGVGGLLFGVGQAINAAGFELGEPPLKTLNGGLVSVGFLVGGLGGMILGFASLNISLNAMRTGLLTRFMGVLGILVGGLLIAAPLFPIDRQGVIRAFWLGALGFLLALKWPSGAPRAWLTGEAEPWPSAAEQRARRAAAAEAEADSAPGGSGGSTKKRKRKR